MRQTETIIQEAEQHCKAHGTKLTNKRKQVLSALIQSTKALSAYEIIAYCKEAFQTTLPAMSVYRILEFLEEAGLVHKLNLANKYVACADFSCDHRHRTPQFLICKACHVVNEVNLSQPLISELKQTVAQANYQLLSPQVELSCLCQDCADQAK